MSIALGVVLRQLGSLAREGMPPQNGPMRALRRMGWLVNSLTVSMLVAGCAMSPGSTASAQLMSPTGT